MCCKSSSSSSRHTSARSPTSALAIDIQTTYIAYNRYLFTECISWYLWQSSCLNQKTLYLRNVLLPNLVDKDKDWIARKAATAGQVTLVVPSVNWEKTHVERGGRCCLRASSASVDVECFLHFVKIFLLRHPQSLDVERTFAVSWLS